MGHARASGRRSRRADVAAVAASRRGELRFGRGDVDAPAEKVYAAVLRGLVNNAQGVKITSEIRRTSSWSSPTASRSPGSR